MKALIEIQSELKAPKGKTNTFGNYKYRSCEDILESVKPICKTHGCLLTLSDEIVQTGDRYYIKATATITDGKEIATVSALARESESKKGMDDSQITGTASSYARKYALNGLFCIDDTKDADTDEYTVQRKAQQDKKVTEAQIDELVKLCDEKHKDVNVVLKFYQVNALNDLTFSQYEKAKKQLSGSKS